MKRIKHLRTENKIQQKDLAKALGISSSALSQWELGRYEPDIRSLHILADYFNVSIDYLLERTDDKHMFVRPVNDGSSETFIPDAPVQLNLKEQTYNDIVNISKSELRSFNDQAEYFLVKGIERFISINSSDFYQNDKEQSEMQRQKRLSEDHTHMRKKTLRNTSGND